MEIEFTNIIQKIAVEQGKIIFLESKKFKALLYDYTKNEYKKECSLLLALIDADCVNYINNTENITDCKKLLVKRLEDEHNLSPVKTDEMLDLLFFVLRGEKIQASSSIEELVKEYSARGMEFYQEYKYDRAIEEYNEAIRLGSNLPNIAPLYGLRGIAYNDKGDYDLAIADFTRMIKLYPHSVAYRNRGCAYMKKDEFDRAFLDFGAAIQHDQNDTVSLFNRGLIYADKSDFKRAAADFEAVLRLEPDHANARQLLEKIREK